MNIYIKESLYIIVYRLHIIHISYINVNFMQEKWSNDPIRAAKLQSRASKIERPMVSPSTYPHLSWKVKSLGFFPVLVDLYLSIYLKSLFRSKNCFTWFPHKLSILVTAQFHWPGMTRLPSWGPMNSLRRSEIARNSGALVLAEREVSTVFQCKLFPERVKRFKVQISLATTCGFST